MSNARTLASTINSSSQIVVPSGGIAFTDLYSDNNDITANEAYVLGQDGYETGSWTPVVAGVTLTVDNGTYTKVGNVVTAQFHINLQTTTSLSDAEISGLPFTVTGNTGAGRSAGFLSYNPSGTAYTLLFASGTSNVQFRNVSGGTVGTITDVSGKLYWGTLIYRAA